MAREKKENAGGMLSIIAVAVVIVLVVVLVVVARQNVQYKDALSQINQNVDYVINNVYYRLAPKDIKEKLENINTLSSEVVPPAVEEQQGQEAGQAPQQ